MTGSTRHPPRTYIRRQGRMTDAQRRHLVDTAAYDVPAVPARIDVPALFGRAAPLWLEIGFGMGHALLEAARAHPDWNLLGIEVYRPGIGAVLKTLRAEAIANVRLIEGDAIAVLRDRLHVGSVHCLCVFFPDPWPKRRHHKRRLINLEFVHLAASRLAVGGHWLLATDYEPYAEQMLEVLDAEPLLENAAGPGNFAPRSTARPETRFERRGLALGHVVRDLCYRRIGECGNDVVEKA